MVYLYRSTERYGHNWLKQSSDQYARHLKEDKKKMEEWFMRPTSSTESMCKERNKNQIDWYEDSLLHLKTRAKKRRVKVHVSTFFNMVTPINDQNNICKRRWDIKNGIWVLRSCTLEISRAMIKDSLKSLKTRWK